MPVFCIAPVQEPQERILIALKHPIFLSSFPFGILAFLLPVYSKRLGASALEIGGLFSIFSITTLLRPVFGRAMDRHGRKSFLVAGLCCYATAMILFLIANTIPMLYGARLVQGLGSSLLWVAAYTMASEAVQEENRGNAAGLIDAASARGALCGAIIGFTMLAWLPLRVGWPILFTIYAVLAAVGVWLAWRYVPETCCSPPVPAKGGKRLPRQLIQLLATVFATSLSTAMLSPLLLVLLQDMFTTSISSLAIAFIPAALVYSFLPALLGRLADRLGYTRLLSAGLAVSGLVSLFIPSLPALEWLVFLWTLEAVGLAGAAPAQEALVASLTERETRAAGYGLATGVAGLGATFGPLLGGWLYDVAGSSTPFYLNGVALLAGALWVMTLGRNNSLAPVKTVDRI